METHGNKIASINSTLKIKKGEKIRCESQIPLEMTNYQDCLTFKRKSTADCI